MSKCIIAGGGAAGMMAAVIAARNGNQVILFEKNEKLGKKLFITGKGRCNFTNAGDSDDIFNSVVTNQKFLYSAFNGFTNYDTMGFFDELGLKFKVERGNRVFPESDHSSDVIGALHRELKKLHVDIRLNTEILEVCTENGAFSGVVVRDVNTQKTRKESGDRIIIATGGNSYQSTGSTGDGYKFAKSLGHQVTPILPALVPFTVKEEWERQLQGLSLKNVSVTVSDMDSGKEIYSDFGEMLFTHFGVSGPTVLSASSYAAKLIKNKPLKLVIDLKPALDMEQLDERVLRDFEEVQNKSFKNALDKLLPKKLIPVVVELSQINPDKKVNEITRQERQALVKLLKNFTLTLTG
ncbi:MAG: aminoacetone oxidase family FAD-binding enzyme, partial [Lachnospira sp.]|nr:aminoacetone oxidase family FAD-binding enzyme [Lachnospira sp.]